jgi:iron complex transport system permease protein
MPKPTSAITTAVAIGVLVLSMGIATAAGAVAIPFGDVVHTITSHLAGNPDDDTVDAIIWDIRFPRVVLAAMVGASLAIAGASYQGVFRNPLADPYLLGTAAGAGVGATIAISYLQNQALLAPLAFIGAFGGVGLAWAVGSAAGGRRNPAVILLAGVAVMSFLTAVQTLLQQQRADTLQEVYSWILGQLSTSGWGAVTDMAPYMFVSSVLLLAHARSLDVLALGDEKARTLGLSVARVRVTVVAAASLATAAAVAASGLIGFVGLVVPHIVRRFVGPGNRLVLPLSLVGGATFLVMADLIARTVLAPAELPIGVVTAFAGAPFFALMLRATRRQWA